MYVLITYASEHGGTRKIAHVIATMLRFQRIRLSIQPLENVQDMSEFDAVIIGSAADHNAWLPYAEQFILKNVDELAEKDVWMFSSGGINHPIPKNLSGAMQIIQPLDATIFGNSRDSDQSDQTLSKKFRNWDGISYWAEDIVKYLKGRVLTVTEKTS